ncbi:ChaC-like protein [compost metagenome]
MDPRHPLYESDTRTQVIAPLIAAASGPLGTNAQYLFSLDQELTRLGMQDDCLNELVAKVKALIEGDPREASLCPGFA